MAVLSISAVADDIPEERELFTLSLLPPEGGAKLGKNVQITIAIERNDAPYGLIQLYQAGGRSVKTHKGCFYDLDVI